MAAGNSFMFLETFKDVIEEIRKKYSDDVAGMFCLELIRFGVRRERKVTMDDFLEATLIGMCPYILKSQERMEQTVKKREADARAHFAGRSKKDEPQP